MKNNDKVLHTPYYVPIINIITGPPPVLQNGGVWKHVKIKLFKEKKIDGFMTQILHFTDYGVSEASLENWLKTSIPERIKDETGHSPMLFMDSGGFRLLYNSSLNLEKFNISPTVKGILELQRAFGGDAIATLDYPLPPGLHEVEVRERINKTIDNCVETVRLYPDYFPDNDAFIYMAVHGRNRLEAKRSVKTLFRRLKTLKTVNLEEMPLAVAIGSLVPLNSSPIDLIDVVYGVREGLREVDWIDPLEVPVHAFGVSSKTIPYLAALGVDTFDGTTYVQQAQNLRYVNNETFAIRTIDKLDRFDCNCEYCDILNREGINNVRGILKGKSFGKIDFDGRSTIKSEVYALLALHNLQASTSLTDRVREAVTSEEMLKQLFIDASRDQKMRRAMAYFLTFFPESRQLLREIIRSQTYLDDYTFDVISEAKVNSFEPEGAYLEDIVPQESKSLKYGPEFFDVSKTNFEPEPKPALLLLPCSQTKPYSFSRSHKLIRKILEENGITESNYVKVTISGNYGPVPQAFETEKCVQEYDFYLNSHDDARIRLISERTRNFVMRHSDKFQVVVGYATAKSYRTVLEIALEGIPNAVVLPSPLKMRRMSEFGKKENVQQLVKLLSRYTLTKGESC